MRSLSLREKRLIQVAALLAIVVVVSLLLPGGEEGLPTPPAPARPAPPPATAPVPATQAPVPAVPAAPAGLRLHGLLASGAVISSAGGGGQRLVPVGREAAPGLTLVRVEHSHAVLRGPAGEFRLGFEESGQPAPAGVRPQP